MAIYRFVSDQFQTYVRKPEDLVFSDLAVQQGVQFQFWPRIISENLPEGNDPRWIWETDPVSAEGAVSGLVRFFGRSATIKVGVREREIVIPFSLVIAADNAFAAMLQVSDAISGIVYETFTILNGNLSVNTGLSEVTPPYNWQNIKTFTGEVAIPASTTDIRFDLEIQGINYVNIGGTPFSNSAGIQFLLELMNLLDDADVTNNIPIVLFKG